MRKYYSQILIGIFMIFCLITIVKPTTAQVIFSQGFESTVLALPSGWITSNFSNSSDPWMVYTHDSHTGRYSAASFNNEPADNWMFSPQVNLVEGRRYILNFWYNTSDSSKFKVALASGTDYGQQQTTLFTKRGSTNYQFQEFIDTFYCELSGSYFIGFQNGANSYNVSTAIILDDIVFSEYVTPACNNIVEAGTITSSLTSVCFNENFTLINHGNTIAENIRFAWQKSVDGTNWVNLANRYSNLPIQISQTLPTYYRIVDTCLNNGSSSISNEIFVDMANFANCYCTPDPINCYAQTINNVSISGTSLNNSSTDCSQGYSNFTALPASNIYKGLSTEVKFTVSSNIDYQIAVWIDFNQNGVFEENEFFNKTFIPGLSSSNSILCFIPTGALNGNTRLRIRYALGTIYYPLLNWQHSCNSPINSGEYEDYVVNIQTAPTCSGTVTAGTISATAAVCPNTVFTLQVNGATANAHQMRYAWQKSLNGSSWTNFQSGAATNSTISLSQNESTWYRYVDTCLASGQSAISNVLQVNSTSIFGCYCVPTSSSNCSTFGVDSVKLNTINDAPTCSGNGYTNNTTISTTLNSGSVYNLFIKLKPGNQTKYVRAFIDFNRNGIMNGALGMDPIETILSVTTTGTYISANIAIPYDSRGGEALLRIMIANNNQSSSACNFTTYGQTLDYKVILNPSNNPGNKFSYYVKQNATGTNNGLSWSSAFNSLPIAFTIAQAGDTIRVAKGTYTPGNSVYSVLPLKDSLIILGGYPDNGNPTDVQRNFSDNPTIISGEIGGPQFQDNVEKLFNVGRLKGIIIDGFIIEKFYAAYRGNDNPGPIVVGFSTIKFRNTVLRNNYSASQTCGLEITNGSIVDLENCFIENNETDNANFKVTKSKLNIVNSVIAKNKAKQIILSNQSDINIINTNVYKNYGFSIIQDSSNLIIKNSIFYQNATYFILDKNEFEKDIYSSIQLSNTITQFYNSGSPDFIGGDPMFKDTANIAGADGKYFNADDGLRLISPCSKAINAGNNSAVSAISSDITGAPRIKNGIVDIGAYEVQETINAAPSVLYVNLSATGLNNGTSWANAFTNLQKAFNNCSDTIKIAKGIYPVSDLDSASSFVLQNNRVVIGGYSGISSNNVSDPAANPTILDGTLLNGKKVDCVVSSNGNNASAKLMNVEIRNSSDNYYGNVRFSEDAALEMSSRSEAVFENVTIAGYYNESEIAVQIKLRSNPTFINCRFFNGNKNSYISITSDSYPKFTGCYFGKDTTATYSYPSAGILISVANAKLKIDSSVFYQAYMDAITIQMGADVEINSTSFLKTNGRSINMDGGKASFNQCIFKDSLILSSIIDGRTTIHANGAVALYTNCKFYDAYTYYDGPFSHISGLSNVTFNRCFFMNGRSHIGQSAFYIKGATLNLINSVISNPLQASPPIECERGAELNIISSTIIVEPRKLNYYNIHYGIIWMKDSSKLKLYNSALWRYDNCQSNPQENDITSYSLNNPQLIDIRNSYLYKQENTVTQNTFIGIEPKFSDLSNPYGPDNILGTEDDGYKPCICSPLVNTGNSSLNSEALDILKQNRIYGSGLDIGAYEVQEATDFHKTFYVKENAPDNGDGKTWATAYNSLQKAVLNNCAETIRVTQGTFKPAVYSRDSTFNIYSTVSILGGYPNIANPTDAQRDPVLYPTILSGDIGIIGDSTDNIKTIVNIHCLDSTITLDGLVIEKGNSDNNQVNKSAGIEAYGIKKLNINNCIIRNNYAFAGGGFRSAVASLEINKTIFKNNRGVWNTALILGYSKNIIRNSVFDSNEFSVEGSAIENSGRETIIENSIFYKNRGQRGTAITSTNSTLFITNCNFIKNNSSWSVPVGNAIYIADNGNPLNTFCSNSVFAGNTNNDSYRLIQNGDFCWGNQIQPPVSNLQKNYFMAAMPPFLYDGIAHFNNLLINEVDAIGPDNLWFTADDGLRPSPCSPLLDAGANSRVENIIPLDILGNLRIQNNTVDIGAYEGPGALKAKIVSSDTTLCAAIPITFRASTNSYSNTHNVYQWYLNGATVGANIDTFLLSLPANNDKVWVTVINPTCGATNPVYSDTIKLVIGTSTPVQLIINASLNNICAGTNVEFSSSFIGDITDSTYQWKVNGNNVGNNSASFNSSSLVQGDLVSLMLTGQSQCSGTLTSNSNIIIMNVSQNLTPDVQLSTTTNNVCSNQNVMITATPTNGGLQPSYQWFLNGLFIGTSNQNVANVSPIDGYNEIKVVITSSLTCTTSPTDTSDILEIMVNPLVTPVVNIVASTSTICQGGSVTFTATPVNGGNTPIYQWKKNNEIVGTNSPTFTSSNLGNNDVISVIMLSNQTCLTATTVISNNITITVSGSLTTRVSIRSSQPSLCANSPVTFEAVDGINLGDATYKWFINGNEINGATSSVFTYTNFAAGTHTITLTAYSSLSCASPSSYSVTLSIDVVANINPTISIPSRAEVEVGMALNINATVQNAGTSPIYQWQDSTALHSWQNIAAGDQQQLMYTAQATGDKLRVNLVSNAQCASPNDVFSNTLVFTVTDTTQIGGRIYLYPNPTRDRVTVAGLQIADNWKTLDLIDMNGRKIIPQMNIVNQTSVQLTVSKNSAGVYMVILRKENGELKYLKLARQ